MIDPMRDIDILFRSRGVKHFHPKEVIALGKRQGSAVVTMPPRELWWHIMPTLNILDRVRDAVGPVKVLSGYRPPDYNKIVGGARDSMHVHFNAVDWRPVEFEDWDIDELAWTVEQVLGSGMLKMMGLGVYQDPNPNDDYKAGFIHMDTRGIVHGRVGAYWEG